MGLCGLGRHRRHDLGRLVVMGPGLRLGSPGGLPRSSMTLTLFTDAVEVVGCGQQKARRPLRDGRPVRCVSAGAHAISTLYLARAFARETCFRGCWRSETGDNQRLPDTLSKQPLSEIRTVRARLLYTAQASLRNRRSGVRRPAGTSLCEGCAPNRGHRANSTCGLGKAVCPRSVRGQAVDAETVSMPDLLLPGATIDARLAQGNGRDAKRASLQSQRRPEVG
jgi:hypothetical protein